MRPNYKDSLSGKCVNAGVNIRGELFVHTQHPQRVCFFAYTLSPFRNLVYFNFLDNKIKIRSRRANFTSYPFFGSIHSLN